MRNFSLNRVQLLPGDSNASQWNFPCLQSFVLLRGPATRHVTVRAKTLLCLSALPNIYKIPR